MYIINIIHILYYALYSLSLSIYILYTYVYIYTHKCGLKSSKDDNIVAVDDFIYQWHPTTAILTEDVFLLKNKLH